MNIIQLSVPIFFLLILVELGWAWFKHKRIYSLSDAFANIGCGITEQLSGLLVKVVTVGAYSYIYIHYSLFDLPDSWLIGFLLFLSIDFSYYWAHRMSHRINLLWIGHIVHHQSESYNLSVALRQGALQKLFTLPFFLWMAFMGFQDTWFLFIYALNTLYQFWIHTESIRFMPKWFEFIFNSPSHHRVHHGRNQQYIDKNHGGSLIIWDRIFGTFEPEKERVVYGVSQKSTTWNPIYAHWLPIKDLIQLLKGMPMKRWLRILFYSPSWLHQQGYYLKSGVKLKSEYQSYMPKPLFLYALIHFIFLLGLISFFLFGILGTSDIFRISGFVILFVLQLALIAQLFMNRSYILSTEFIRILLVTVCIYLFLDEVQFELLAMALFFQILFTWIPIHFKTQSITVHPTNAV